MEALAAVTIGAAYSWRMEHEIVSIAVGKLATFTVLADDPMLVDPESLHDIEVVGTIYEGQWHPAADTPSAAPHCWLRLQFFRDIRAPTATATTTPAVRVSQPELWPGPMWSCPAPRELRTAMAYSCHDSGTHQHNGRSGATR